MDWFAFGPAKMLGTDPAVIDHRLNADLMCKLVAKKKRHMGVEQYAPIVEEVRK